MAFEVNNPIVRYADSISVNTVPGNVPWKVGSAGHIGYVRCWVNINENNHSWLSTINFSTKDVLQEGVVRANTCRSATLSSNPGQIVLFVRLPSAAESWRQAWN